ncbi:MAG: site-specific integrase [Halopseudomonas sp.]
MEQMIPYSAGGGQIEVRREHEKQHNPAFQYLTKFSGESRRVAHSRLKWAVRVAGGTSIIDTDWRILDRMFMNTVREMMEATKVSLSAINGVFSAMRGVAQQAWELDLIGERQFRLVMETKNIKITRAKKQRYIDRTEVENLLRAARAMKRIKGIRDAAVIALLYSGGLRRAELAGMCVEDIHVEDRGILIQGKGQKERWIYPPDSVWGLLLEWLREGLFISPGHIVYKSRTSKPSRNEDDQKSGDPIPVFVRIRKGDDILAGQQLTPRAIQIICEGLRVVAGVNPFTPHDFRGSFITRMLEEGHDLSMVASLVGHSNPETTAGYDRRGEEKRAEVFRSLRIEF